MGETTVFDMSKGGSFAEAYIAARNAALANFEMLKSREQKSEWIDIDAYLQGSDNVHE